MGKIIRDVGPIGWNIIIGTVFGRMATSMSMPFLAIYLTKSLGVSPAMTGAVVAVSSLVGVLGSFLGGYLSDHFGRKRILILSIFLWAAVFAGYGFSKTIIAFFVMNSLNGLCRALFEPASRALLSDITEPRNRLLIFNLRYTAINVGVTFGPLLGLKLGSANSTTTFFIAGIIYAAYGLSLVISLRSYRVESVAENRIEWRDAVGVIKKDKIFTLALFAMILSIVGYSQFNSTLPQFFSSSDSFENGVAVFSYLLALNAILVVCLQYPIVTLSKRFPSVLSIATGNLVVSLALLGFAFAKTVPALILIMLLFTIGEVLMFSMTDVFIDELADPAMKGTYFGAMGFSGFGGVAGPWLGGVLLGHFGTGQPFYLFGMLSVAAIFGVPLFLLVYFQLKKRQMTHNRLSKNFQN
ncbi:MFS transporter [Peribacillus cavernae]|uniref:MFS transporter n=1 Tax=Peribacillus cavernae TaxID=1674310 RepID=A0A3S0TUL6_9BACI|nr:MFS transporter [Peribacillus cavernae]MDQ0217835.1 MFS family permease [Peribacillus cavernae]RUQ28279.1 MFS transporter [Peribacillus cavernae]